MSLKKEFGTWIKFARELTDGEKDPEQEENQKLLGQIAQFKLDLQIEKHNLQIQQRLYIRAYEELKKELERLKSFELKIGEELKEDHFHASMEAQGNCKICQILCSKK